MTIGYLPSYIFTLPAGSVKPTSPPDGKPDRQTDEPSTGFDDVLANVLERQADDSRSELADRTATELSPVIDALEGGIEIIAAGREYSLRVAIGDRAISFQAKPVVGPTATDSKAVSTAAAEGPPIPGTAALAAPDMPPKTVSDAVAGPLEPSGRGLAMNPTLHGSARADRVGAAVAPRTFPASVATSPPNTAVTPQPAKVGSHAKAEQATRPMPAAPPTMQPHAKAQIFAQLVASAAEYRLAVRGAQLSDTQMEEICQEVRATLYRLGLGDRPVRVTQAEVWR